MEVGGLSYGLVGNGGVASSVDRVRFHQEKKKPKTTSVYTIFIYLGTW